MKTKSPVERTKLREKKSNHPIVMKAKDRFNMRETEAKGRFWEKRRNMSYESKRPVFERNGSKRPVLEETKKQEL